MIKTGKADKTDKLDKTEKEADYDIRDVHTLFCTVSDQSVLSALPAASRHSKKSLTVSKAMRKLNKNWRRLKLAPQNTLRITRGTR